MGMTLSIIVLAAWVIIGILQGILYVRKQPVEWSSYWLAYAMTILFLVCAVGDNIL